MSETCLLLGIPNHLHQAKREVDNIFDVDELLFRRFKGSVPYEEWCKENTELSSVIFPLNEDSYNRSKYCVDPSDVLYNDNPEENGKHFSDFGIYSIRIEHINSLKNIKAENIPERVFSLKVEHVPKECNYPHSEVWVFEGQEKMPISKKAPKSIKMLLRDFLFERINDIEKFPEN